MKMIVHLGYFTDHWGNISLNIGNLSPNPTSTSLFITQNGALNKFTFTRWYKSNPNVTQNRNKH